MEVSLKGDLGKTMNTSANHIDITTSGEVTLGQIPGLAIAAPVERTCVDAQPVLDPESIERFCRVWADVGRAILKRRSTVPT